MTATESLDHAAIAARIPHAGRMCLLGRVRRWNADGVDAESLPSPARVGSGPGHPLARHGGLPATAAIEYAAQAMALHGALVAQGMIPPDRSGRPAAVTADTAVTPFTAGAPRHGFLAAVRGVQFAVRWIDPGTPHLIVRVRRFAGDPIQVLYDFEVDAAGAGRVAAGRAIVVLDAAGRGGRDAPARTGD